MSLESVKYEEGDKATESRSLGTVAASAVQFAVSRVSFLKKRNCIQNLLILCRLHQISVAAVQ